MAIRPRPPFPSIDPIDPCLKLGAQLAYIREAVNYSKGLLTRSSGSAFVNRRQSLLFRELEETFASYASDWNGSVPPIIPPLCRGLYRTVMGLRREGLWMLNMVRMQADQYVGPVKVVDGFTINRPHNRRAHLLNMMTT
jgi:hypothetical protein